MTYPKVTQCVWPRWETEAALRDINKSCQDAPGVVLSLPRVQVTGAANNHHPALSGHGEEGGALPPVGTRHAQGCFLITRADSLAMPGTDYHNE